MVYQTNIGKWHVLGNLHAARSFQLFLGSVVFGNVNSPALTRHISQSKRGDNLWQCIIRLYPICRTIIAYYCIHVVITLDV